MEIVANKLRYCIKLLSANKKNIFTMSYLKGVSQNTELTCFLIVTIAAKLIVESDNFGRVKIKGAKTHYYLCFKKNGRLVGRKVTLRSYVFFIIICTECLNSGVYIALIGRIIYMCYLQILDTIARFSRYRIHTSFIKTWV